MGAREVIVTVELGEVGGRMRGYKVGLEGRSFAVQCAADDLFDLACVEVDAGAEACHFHGLLYLTMLAC